MRTIRILTAVTLSLLATISQAKSISVSSAGSSVIEDMNTQKQSYQINIALPNHYEASDDVVKDLFDGAYQTLIEFVGKNSAYGSKIQSIQKDGSVIEGAKGMIKIVEAVEPRPVLLISEFHQPIKIEIDDHLRRDALKMRRFEDEADKAIRSFLNNTRTVAFWSEEVALPATNIPQYTLLSRNKRVIYSRSSELPQEMSQTYQASYRNLAERLMSDIEAKCRSIINNDKCDSESADIEIEDSLSHENGEYLIEMQVKATYQPALKSQ